MSIELGGFAESPDAIDGTEEEFNAFNYCLAEDYYDAVLGEDFEGLGEVLNDGLAWCDLMHTVCDWLNYDGVIGESLKDNFTKLCDGTITTCKHRTFIEAAREHGWHQLVNDLSKISERGYV